MARKSHIPIEIKKIRLFAGDFDRIGALYPTQGASVAIRTILRNFIERHEKAVKPLDIDLGALDLEELTAEDRT